jgi:2'-hydroxyisoflavone reductase
MRLLIIGGTSFLGRATAEEALDRGWEVTTFNRGQSNPDVAGVEALRGDRDDDTALEQLAGRPFDVVVDTCGFVPRVVGKAARVLAGSGAHYVFVSSISATPTWPGSHTPENVEGQPCASDAGPEDGDYGVLKAGCERAVREVFGDRATIARAGLIIGPHENVGRLPAWLDRMARGGEVLAPGTPDLPMQLVDARDLAAFMLGCGESGTPGTFNATAPTGNATYRSMLEDCRTATGSDATLTWVDDGFLLERDVQPWTELPLWMPLGVPGDDNGDHVWDADTSRTVAAGMRNRPVRDSIDDTWAWLQDGGRPAQRPRHASAMQHGIDPDKEAAILAAWHARRAVG